MGRIRRSFTAIGAVCLGGATLLAQAQAAEFTGRLAAWVAPENPKCTCRFKGEHLPLGAHRCIQTPAGPRTAECVTEQNVTSWRPSQDACPQASLQAPLTVRPDRASAGLL